MAKYVESREVMGTWATVTLIAPDDASARRAADRAFAALDSVQALMSPRVESSEVYRINEAGFEAPQSVSEATFHVLQRARATHQRSQGAFDVTVGPLIRLWRECAGAERLPTDREIEEARRKTGCANLILDPDQHTVRFAVDGMRIDLGGIAKGYGIDLAVTAARRAGIERGIVEVGGDLRCFGALPRRLIGQDASTPANLGLWRSPTVEDREPVSWPLGLQSPFGEELLGKIRVAGAAVATSGHYRRYVTLAGKRYSHILDPRTGWPVESPASVTVIAPDALTADALATSITVLGVEDGLALAESMPGVEALIVEGEHEKPRLRHTSGFPKVESLD